MGLQCAGAGRQAHGRAAVWALQHPQTDRVGQRFSSSVAVQIALGAVRQHRRNTAHGAGDAGQAQQHGLARKLLGLFSQPDGSKKTSASRYACRMAAASSGPV